MYLPAFLRPVIVAVAVLWSLPAAALDPAGDFSPLNNPNGPWQYGYKTTLGGPLGVHADRGSTGGGLDYWRTNLGGGVPRVAHNPTTIAIAEGTYIVEPGALSLHPGPGGEFAAVRFTANAAGNYRVAGSFFGQDIGPGTSTDVHILRNGVAAFGNFVTGFGPGSATPFDLSLALAVGDTVDFLVGYGAGMNFAFDSTGLTATVRRSPATINAAAITNYSGYIIAADQADGNPATNRHRIRSEAEIDLAAAGDYRVAWEILDPGDIVVATDSSLLPPGSSGVVTVIGQVVPPSATPLVPATLYRQKTSVINVATGAVLATQTEPTGRAYIHFTGTDSASTELNVVTEVTSVTADQSWLLETDAANDQMPVTVNYRVHRYDDWLGASVNKIIVCDLTAAIERASDGAVLASTATSTGFVSPVIASHVAGAPLTPAVVAGSTLMLVDPSAILAPSDYRFKATVAHIEDPPRLLETPPVLVTRLSNAGASPAAAVDHFSGQLNFGSITTHFAHLAGAPAPYVGAPPPPAGQTWRRIAPDADSGSLDGRNDFYYGDGSTLNVSLGIDGVATLLPSNGPGISASVDLLRYSLIGDFGVVNGIDYLLRAVTLDTAGAHADVRGALPSGVGWTGNRKAGLLDAYLEFADVSLDQALTPIGPTPAAILPPGDFYLCEETKPILIQTASLTWDIPAGEFLCGPASARSIRKPLLEILSSYAYSDPAMGTKRSNDHLYNFATTATGMRVQIGGGGGGELSGTIGINPGGFVSHFPYDSTVKWNTAAAIHLVGDLIDVAPSALVGVDPLLLPYWQHCQEEVEAGCGLEQTSTITFTPPSGTLFFTADGGLQAAGTVAVPGLLSWGWNSEAAQYAHQVATTFTAGNFLMAGTFLRGDQNVLEDEDGASVLLLSGFDPANLGTAERPLTAPYGAGLGDYAGINFRCASGSFDGLSNLQGTPYGAYPLTARSKYYARQSGVTGIHEATAGFPGAATIAGYAFIFSSYGFSFLSTEMEDSRTAGDIDFPDPVDFTLPFTNLELSGVGALETVAITGAGAVDSKEFDFWNAPFTPYTIDFVSTDSCNPASGTTLVLGFSAHASHFAVLFGGSLGIKPDGHFATDADIAASTVAAEVPTRLTLPAALTATGTTGETYTFFPAQGAYLNSAASATTGYWSLFGTLDVPFFEDMEVHIHASCAANDTLSPLYFMGGWPADGWEESSLTPFEVTVFDTAQIGAPPAVTLDAYRKTIDNGTDLYLPRAQKLWLGVIDFDYPLKWSNTAFNFLSRGPVESDFLVVRTQHELTFLDAQNAEITFGLRYDGLPEISLSNFVFNAVDDATGVTSALVSAAGDEVFGALENGVDEFGHTLSDAAEELMGRAVEAAIAVPIDGLIAVIKAELADGVWTTADLQAATATYLSVPANQLGTALNNLGTAYANPQSLVFDLDQRLAKIEQGIDSVINTVTLDPVTGTELATPADGLLRQIDVGGGELRRLIFEAAGTALVDALAPEVEATSITAELNALIAAQEPALAAVTTALTEVRAVVTALRAELQGGTGLGDEIRDLVAAGNAQITTVSATVGAQVEALFLAVEPEDVAVVGALDALGDEWHAAITEMVKDELYATQLIADIQTAVKERLYDLQGAFNGAVDTAFAALNQSIRDALSPVLAELDTTINRFIGDLGDKLGSGSLTGAAHLNGDSLDSLRLDASLELKVPDALTLAGFIEIKELDSDGPECCGGAAGAFAVEVEVGALDVGLAWTGLSLGTDTRADLSLKAAFNGGTGLPIGLGGSFELTQGSISFEAFEITALGASAMFSVPNAAGFAENYFAAVVGLDFNSYELAGGIFFGQSCDLEPIEMIDPLVASILTGPSFTGIYGYGEATFPVFGTGTCLFNISAKAGAGIFYAAEGPTFGGRMSLGIYGEALCAVSVGGEIDLVGAKTGDTYAFAGTGRVFGEAGVCPFCVKANLQCDFNYTKATGWKVEY